MTTSRSPLTGLRKKHEAEAEQALYNIEVYYNSPSGIGEHPDIAQAVEEQVKRYVDAIEMVEAIEEIETKML